ncbi:MAG: DUF4234 domain-containing protein [Nitrospirae bacterium]|nr:MAG: DUF4234 domain-containing protein [Nitrospirota bacterium]
MSAGWTLIPLLQTLDAVILIAVFFAVVFSAIFSAAQSGTVINRAALTASLFGLFLLFGVISFVLSILFAYVLYRLVKRRNTHFARQSMLYEDIERAAREASVKKGVDVSVPLNNLYRLRREAQLDETPRDPVLWSVILVFAAGLANSFSSFNLTGGGVSSLGVALIPSFAMYYVYYFLMKDMFRHERREDWFFGELNRTFAAMGINITLPQRLSPIPDRSLIVYIILTIVTLGFFGVYWVYVLISDPNNHFRYQSMVEDTTLAQVSPILV